MYKHERGNTLRITSVCTDPDTGALVDPDSVTCVVTKPYDVQFYSGAMTQVGTGTYRAEIETAFTDDLGYWLVKIYGTYDAKQIGNSEKFKMVEVK